jgi:hypothetical protein
VADQTQITAALEDQAMTRAELLDARAAVPGSDQWQAWLARRRAAREQLDR